MSLLDHALGHAADGFRVFPVRPKGKKPAITGWQDAATTDEEQIRAWWTQNPEYNIGLVAGDGLAVLDVDPEKGGSKSLAQLIEEHGEIRTKVVRTGGGGFHLYFTDDPDAPLPQSAGRIAPGLDTRAGGKGYVVGAGSVHPSGNLYEPHNGSAPGAVPGWLREMMLTSSRRDPVAVDREEVAPGERNDWLARVGGALRRRGLNPEAIAAALKVENQLRCDPPLPEEEVEKIAQSVGRYAPDPRDDLTRPETAAEDEFDADPEATPPEPSQGPSGASTDDQVDLTDEWAVHRVLPALSKRLRYVPGTGSSGTWHVWNGHQWKEDGALEHERIVRDHLTRIARWLEERAAAAATKSEGRPAAAAARRFQSAAGITSIVRLLRAHLACRPTDFDTDPHLLNTPGGVVDLETGEIRPVSPDGMHARSTALAPAEGPHPLWDRFVKDLTDGDPDLARYLQKMLGYALTGDVSEKTLWFIWGADSDTGKSTFIRVISALFGSYADSVDVAAFISGFQGERIPADLARLPGVRLVTATEPAAGHAWDERRIKAITGGDEISARFLYGQWFTYQPQFKIVIVGNHEPEIRTVDDAMLRRIHIVPFDRKIPREKQIENLAQILVEREGAAILQWMIEGCLAWREEGLAPPEVVLQRTADYESEEDVLQQWVDEECVLDPEAETSRRDLYHAWAAWCRSRGEKPGTLKTLKRQMDPKKRELGLEETQIGERRLRGYRGIRLRLHVEPGADFTTPEEGAA